jgi:hypothetical protein
MFKVHKLKLVLHSLYIYIQYILDFNLCPARQYLNDTQILLLPMPLFCGHFIIIEDKSSQSNIILSVECLKPSYAQTKHNLDCSIKSECSNVVSQGCILVNGLYNMKPNHILLLAGTSLEKPYYTKVTLHNLYR